MLGPNFPILGRLLPAPAPVIPVDDEPATVRVAGPFSPGTAAARIRAGFAARSGIHVPCRAKHRRRC